MGTAQGQLRLDDVREACREIASVLNVVAAADVANRWVPAFAGPGAVAALAHPDAAGRLRVVGARSRIGALGRERALLRRTTFRRAEARRVQLHERGRALGLFPLVAQDGPIGVLEVEAASRALDNAWDALGLIAEQLALRLDCLARCAAVQSELDAMRRASDPALELVERREEQLDMGVAWTAHEMLGPILGVRAVLEVLLERRPAGADAVLLRRSMAEIDSLTHVAEALLSYSAGTVQPERRPADVVALVDEAADALRIETGEERIVVSGPPRAISSIDPPFLRTAIVNLLRNALAYSDPGTKVDVAIESDDQRVELLVRNEGRGIAQDERRAIFGPFVRGDTSRGARGTGLGLFIARRAVEAHGGRIWVDSEERTVTFHVTLPREGREERRFVS